MAETKTRTVRITKTFHVEVQPEYEDTEELLRKRAIDFLHSKDAEGVVEADATTAVLLPKGSVK